MTQRKRLCTVSQGRSLRDDNKMIWGDEVVRPEGVEPPTYWFVASCSIQLSYGRTLQATATS